MDMYWWTVQLAKPVLAILSGIGLSKFLIPLKQGWQKNDQKLIARGIGFLIIGLGGAALLIAIMGK